MDEYTIKSGDTLAGLAKKYNTDIPTLAKANNIQNENVIFAGNKLQIPKGTMNTISSNSLQEPANINIPTLPVTPTTYQTAPTVSSGTTDQTNQIAQNNIQKAIDDAFAQEQQTIEQRTASDLQTRLFNSIPELQGQDVELQNQLQANNVPTLSSELKTIQNQILQKQAEMQKSDVELIAGLRDQERRDTTLSFVNIGKEQLQGDAQIARALKSSEIGVLNAQAIAKQGNIDSAIDMAKTAVDTKYSPIKAKIEVYQAQLKALEPILTAQEKQISRKQDIKAKIEMNRIEKLEKEDVLKQEMILKAIQMGAPQSIVNKASNAKDRLEASFVLGKYNRDLDIELKKAQIAKVRERAVQRDIQTNTLSDADIKRVDTSPQGKKLISLSDLYQKSQTYNNLVNQYGFETFGKNKTKLDSAYADLKIAYKEAANLGALTGPDVSLIEEAIKPSSGVLNFFKYKISGGKGGVASSIDDALSRSRNEALKNYKQLVLRNPDYKESEYVRSLIKPFAKDYSTINVSELSKGELIETPDGFILESIGNGQLTPL